MDMSNMKNMIVLKNLPSNLVDEAIVVLKENKKVHRYQVIDTKEEKKEKADKSDKEYIVKEAEMLIKTYTDSLEQKSPKWKKNIKKLEKRYKLSIKVNFVLFFTTVLACVFAIII